MNNRLVLWGENDKQEKVLLTLELKERENQVEIKIIPESLATEELYKSLLEVWKSNKEVVLPEGIEVLQRSLSMTESILPNNLKSDRSDLLTRAQAEWHFNVLSAKLYEMYKSELDEYKEKVDSLSEYSQEVWNEMKGFWEKVQNQVRERNMFRDQAATLKERTNTLFDKLKDLRKEMKKQLEVKSSELAATFNNELDNLEKKVEEGMALNPIFNELKDIQGRFFKGEFTRKDKDKLWGRIDGLFKKVKEAKFGDKGKGNKSGTRLQSRYDGLLKAIQRMKNSIAYDEKDVQFQNNKISTTDGQLEMQIRQAKLVMIQERLNSKKAKLDDMMKTKADLERQLQKEKAAQEKKKLEQEKQKVAEEIKQKIAADISETKKDLQDKADDLKKAAEEIKSSKVPKSESIVDKVLDKAEQIAEDVVDTASAITEVVKDKIEGFVDTEEE